MANLGNYKAIEDWWFFLPAIFLVETILMFVVRFAPGLFGKGANEWFDDFGSIAILSDLSIFAIIMAITRYLYTAFFMEEEGWSIWYFIAMAVILQVVYDIFFSMTVVSLIPKGHNEMIDVLKQYSEAGAKAVLTNSIVVASSIGLAATLKNLDYHYVGLLFLVTLHAATYILFTNRVSR